jgi:hypothetical protein
MKNTIKLLYDSYHIKINIMQLFTKIINKKRLHAIISIKIFFNIGILQYIISKKSICLNYY